MNPGQLIDGFQFQDHLLFHHGIQSEAINFPIVIKNLKFLFRIKFNFLLFQFQKNGLLIRFLPKPRTKDVVDLYQNRSNPMGQFLIQQPFHIPLPIREIRGSLSPCYPW